MSEYQTILGELERITIIDAHEHLPPELLYNQKKVDALTLFSHYCRGDLAAAGLDQSGVDFIFSDGPLMERWAAFEPYYKNISRTAYARAAHIALEHFYGEKKITRENIEPLSEKIKANNTPGLYKRVLRDACKIETCLAQDCYERCDDGLMTPVIWTLNNPCAFSDIGAYEKKFGIPLKSLDDFLETSREQIRAIKRAGGVGFKFFVFPMHKPDREEAAAAFDFLKSNPAQKLPVPNPLSDAFFGAAFDEVAKQDLTACVHTGYWRDFRELHPAHLLYAFDNYPRTRFDVYHVGYPYVRDAILLGKTRANVWLNLCWTYIISPHFAKDALSEILEMVPLHKIIGFGGDYFIPEKVYGHLAMARNVIAEVLAAKIAAGWFTTEEAVDIARMMLYENPKALYRL
jgi:predicted TIM-barrel fold metal-dependent hydrolase